MVSFVNKPDRPKYFNESKHKENLAFNRVKHSPIYNEITFYDMIEVAIDIKEKSRSIVELIKLMRNEINSSKG